MISRRTLLASALAAGSAMAITPPAGADDWATELRRKIADIEHAHGGHLGVAIFDGGRAMTVGRRGDQRFPLCSTSKFLSAAFILSRVDRGQEYLARRIVYGADALVTYSPITGKHVGEPGLTLGEICAAALALSDNTAANLMLDSFGGPAALTAYLRTLGDEMTRLDRRETALNEVAPGDARDTTTPLAMIGLMRRIVLGDALSAASRQRLVDWMTACKTGDKRLRAGAPQNWHVADKTGTGARNATNDIAVFWPPDRPPIAVAAYYVDASGSTEARESVLAAVGRLAAEG